MKKIQLLLFFLLAFLFVSFPVMAKAPKIELIYFEDDEQVEIFDANGEYIEKLSRGMDLEVGTTIKTYESVVELQYDPNKSIVRLAKNTVIKIEEIQNGPKEINGFSLFSGKMRIVSSSANGDENYLVVTQSSVCAFRDADIVIDAIGVLTVQDGSTSFTNLISGETISVDGGQIADIESKPFKATTAKSRTISSAFKEMEFKKLSASRVPKQEIVTNTKNVDNKNADKNIDNEDKNVTIAPKDTKEDKKTYKDTYKREPIESGSAAGILTGGGLMDTNDSMMLNNVNKEETSTEEEEDEKKFKMTFNAGVLNIDDDVYARLVVQPIFDTENFKAKLYLPIIFRENLFAPSSWYQSSDNNEWSFGTDQNGELLPAIFDLLDDILLKLDYIQFGGIDKMFYLRFGAIPKITFGHGILIDDFTNIRMFQTDRNIGGVFDLSFDKFGFQALLDDLLKPSVLGARMEIVPLGRETPLNFGLSIVTDMYPGEEAEEGEISFFYDPIIYAAAFDFSVPITAANMTIYGELAGMTIFKDNKFYWNTFFNTEQEKFFDSLNNYGLKTGIFGNIGSFFNYKFEYNITKGIFNSSIFNERYMDNKKVQSDKLLDYIDSPNDEEFQKVFMDIYSELSFNFFDAVTFTTGYKLPFDSETDDNLELSLEMMPDKIPVIGLYGSLTYSHAGVVNSLNDSTFKFLDSKTILEAELVYPMTSSFDIIFQITNYNTVYSNTDAESTEFSASDFSMSLEMRITL